MIPQSPIETLFCPIYYNRPFLADIAAQKIDWEIKVPNQFSIYRNNGVLAWPGHVCVSCGVNLMAYFGHFVNFKASQKKGLLSL